MAEPKNLYNNWAGPRTGNKMVVDWKQYPPQYNDQRDHTHNETENGRDYYTAQKTEYVVVLPLLTINHDYLNTQFFGMHLQKQPFSKTDLE